MDTMFQRWLKKLYQFGLEYFGLYYGVYRGTCMVVEDPEQQGRIRVRVPAVSGNDTIGTWAWPISPWAGRDSGFFVVPDVSDPVYVVFENGNVNNPMWMGGWWPKPGGDNFAEDLDAYSNGTPQKRIFKTKAGHELSFEDDPENLSCKLIWHDPAQDVYSSLVFTEDGSIQMSNHKECSIEMRTVDDGETNIITDTAGNSIVQDADGTRVSDPFGNIVDLKDGMIEVTASEDVVVNAKNVNINMDVVNVGEATTDSALLGTAFMDWWNNTFKVWLDAHTHPTGVGPSGPPAAPSQAPQNQVVLTDKLKLQ